MRGCSDPDAPGRIILTTTTTNTEKPKRTRADERTPTLVVAPVVTRLATGTLKMAGQRADRESAKERL